MEKMLMRLTVILAVALSLSACGKSKDGSGVSEAPKAPAKPAPAQPLSTPEKVDESKVRKGTVHIPIKTPTDKSQTKTDGKTIKVGSTEILNTKVSSTSAATDSLRELLEAKQEMVKSQDQKVKNKKLALEIQAATLKYNSNAGRSMIDITVGKDKKSAKTVGLIGKIGATVETLASNEKGVTAKAVCMDKEFKEESRCGTVVVDLTYHGSNSKIILRQTGTALKLSAIFPDRNCLAKECEDFYGLIRNTELKTTEPNRIRSSVLTTFEVVEGYSGFKLLIVSEENEVIKIAGLLESEDAETELNTPTDRKLAPEEMKDPQTGELRKTVIHDSLKDVTVVKNDGHGNIKLLAKFKKLENGDQDGVLIELERELPAVHSILDASSSALK